MNKTILSISRYLTLIALIPAAQAVDYDWTGNSGTDWNTAGNWAPSGVPNLGGADNANLGGEAIYDAVNGDLALHAGSTLTIQDGGSWVQTNGVAWIQAIGGTLVVESGGSFDMGTAGNIVRDATTNIFVSGTFNYTPGNFTYDPTSSGVFSLGAGANFIVANEFQPNANFTFANGSTFTGGGPMAVQAGDPIVTVDGAVLSLGNTELTSAGLYEFNGTTSYVDFTSNGGSITISNTNQTQIENAINNGIYRYEGAIDNTNITFTDLGGDTFRIDATAVPESSTYALLLGGAVCGIARLRRRRNS